MQRQIVLRNIQMAILDHEGCKSNMESIQKVDVSFRVLFYMEIIIFEEVNRHWLEGIIRKSYIQDLM
jgi:hypothetical protein